MIIRVGKSFGAVRMYFDLWKTTKGGVDCREVVEGLSIDDIEFALGMNLSYDNKLGIV